MKTAGLSTLCAGLITHPTQTQAIPANRPNVLFIAVDDLRPELGCYGDKKIKSPNIDGLAKQGMVFKRTYCQQAVCGPSRATLLSGLRPGTIGNYDWNIKIREHVPDVVTLPQHFKQNGYETLSIGKIYHHTNDDPDAWTGRPINIWPHPESGWNSFVEKESMEKQKTNPTGLGPAFEAGEVEDNEYPDGANTDYAIEQLQRLKKQDKPFFMAMGYYKPHLPFTAPKKYWDLYPKDSIDLSPNPYHPKDMPAIARSNYEELRSYADVPDQGDLSDELARKLRHGYYACVSFTDAQIGKLLAELKRLELAENTIVILWGDHGWKLGDHNMWCKHTNFEVDTHVPMIISVPGMKKAGAKCDALTEFVDIYPTLAELCGQTLPDHLEGTSVVPLLKKPKRPWKSAAFSVYPRGKQVLGRTMRTKDFRYTRWQNLKTGKVQAEELYDHRRDSSENVNVAKQDAYAADMKRLRAMLDAGWKQARP
jgi:arylsulfatase A-like enzyme